MIITIPTLLIAHKAYNFILPALVRAGKEKPDYERKHNAIYTCVVTAIFSTVFACILLKQTILHTVAALKILNFMPLCQVVHLNM